MVVGNLDLNLLVVLDAVITEMSLKKAAKRIGRSPSATSHALARARQVLGDAIVVPAGRRLVLTPRGEALAGPVRRAVQEIEGILLAADGFDPRQLTWTARVLTTDHVELVFLHRMDAALSAAAPRVDLHCRPVGAGALEELRAGTADLAFGVFGFFGEIPGDFVTRDLFQDRFVSLVREGHPALRARLTPQRFADLQHVMVAPRGGSGGPVDVALAAHGLERRVARTVGSFLPAPHLVAQSDYVVTMPQRMAESLAPMLRLAVFVPPLTLPPFSVAMVWHRRHDAAPAHRWFRDLAARAAAALPPLQDAPGEMGRPWPPAASMSASSSS